MLEEAGEALGFRPALHVDGPIDTAVTDPARTALLAVLAIWLVITFFGGLTALGFGITGQYLWLSLQNARRRPNFIVRSSTASTDLTHCLTAPR